MANPNPSPATRFGAEKGNPSGAGKTSEQRRAEIEAAEKAAKIRNMMLSEMLESLEREEDAKEALEYLTSEALKLFKDSEDRAHGQPEQNVNNRVSGGSEKLRQFIDNIAERSGTDSEPSEE